MDLQNKIAIVTGGGQGLGAAICKSIAQAGATAIVGDIQLEAAEKIAQQIRDSGGDAIALPLDVSNAEQVSETVQKVQDQYGAIDILINNAGTDKTVSIEELEIADWDRVLSVNLRGAFLLSKAVFSIMKQQGRGHIVNVASTAAKRAWPNATAYHASKWGLLGFSHALHTEARPHGVKVTAIVAGGMQTPFILDRFPDTPLDVLQPPENVAETIRYVLMQPEETVIPEVTVLPMRETSWP
ncbi:MAG: SDR family oxidoreductase [Leptolyngbyaceae cyanobacterium SM1_3_5]|nr:SDR family oxidoreductase [Leptolyngbyaceae cyanobacterium SM1_3_5]